jgi:TonB-dependent starch-binding outer membrane protein SusC
MKIKIFSIILIFLLCINNISAQNKKITITGSVISASKEPIVNAIIMIDGKKTNSMTDSQGNFKIKIKPSALKIGIFSFGNGIIEEEISGRTQIDFKFKTIGYQQQIDHNIAPGEEGVGVGYVNAKKKNLTIDVNKIDGTDKKYATYSSISDMIQREVSGVSVGGGVVIIQDSRDLFGSVPALIIVDGVYMDALPNIPPITVKSIEVLKGTSAAIYGNRGYGGAIIIKTKLGNDE